jgi:hypothetical protein
LFSRIADTGRFWKILVIPVLQILEDSGKYWLYQYCRYWKNRYEVAECTFILGVFFNTDLPNLAYNVCIPLLLSPGLPMPCLLSQ